MTSFLNDIDVLCRDGTTGEMYAVKEIPVFAEVVGEPEYLVWLNFNVLALESGRELAHWHIRSHMFTRTCTQTRTQGEFIAREHVSSKLLEDRKAVDESQNYDLNDLVTPQPKE